MADLKKYKKYFLWVFAIAAVVVLLAIVFRSCDKGNPHKQENKETQELIKKANDERDAEKKKSDSLLALNRKLEDERKLTKFKLDVTEDQLNVSKNQSFKLAQDLKAAKARKDTVEYFAKCDSLGDEILNLSGIIISYEDYVHALDSIHIEQLKVKDSLIVGKEKLYSDLRISFDKIATNYNSLYADYGKELKKRKKARTLNRVLGAAVLIVGGLYITK